MTLVLMTPVGLDEACWQWATLPDGQIVKHVFPGFGGRERSVGTADMASLADEVAHAYSGPLDLVGVSMGGMVAQNVTIRHPDRVRSLFTACTGAASNPATMLERAQAVDEGGIEGIIEPTLDRWFSARARSQRPEPPGVVYARQTLLALEPSAFADGWRAIATHDTRAGLPGLVSPTTCVAGDADASSPVSRGEEIAGLVPNCRLVILPGPHMMHLENPDGFSAALAEHLAWVEETV